jgi:hypothetical protein
MFTKNRRKDQGTITDNYPQPASTDTDIGLVQILTQGLYSKTLSVRIKLKQIWMETLPNLQESKQEIQCLR